MNCRICNTKIKHLFISLGSSPLANSYIEREQLHKVEPFYPLNVYVCQKCFLVQTEEVVSSAHIFSEYDYFSSFSKTWVDHSKEYVEKIIVDLDLGQKSRVIEVASNDGYLLQFFKKRNIPLLGIEPASNVAEIAIKKGIDTEIAFFGKNTAKKLLEKGFGADLLIGNNVLAHVPKLNDFVGGMKILLNKQGTITMEFPHLKELVDKVLFDTIYHEHFSYFSFLTVSNLFASHGLKVYDVEQFPLHGGSLRIYACHQDNQSHNVTNRVHDLKKMEIQAGYNHIEPYLFFEHKIRKIKRDILSFLIDKRESGKHIIGYGAPAKGNTLLNYCGISTDFIDFTVDKNPVKQGKYLPGSHIPIKSPDKIREIRPDYIFILPWNIKDEIMRDIAFVREWGGKFFVAIPEIKVI